MELYRQVVGLITENEVVVKPRLFKLVVISVDG